MQSYADPSMCHKSWLLELLRLFTPPPGANVSTALTHLHSTINTQQKAHPDRVHVLGEIIYLTMCIYTLRMPTKQYLGESDHLQLLLIPAYAPLRRKTKANTKIKTWHEGALSVTRLFRINFMECFEYQDLEEYTCRVLFSITSCADITVNKGILPFTN